MPNSESFRLRRRPQTTNIAATHTVLVAELFAVEGTKMVRVPLVRVHSGKRSNQNLHDLSGGARNSATREIYFCSPDPTDTDPLTLSGSGLEIWILRFGED